MPHTTLTVPAKYAEDFRAALVHELAEEADLVKKERRKLLEAVEHERFLGTKADDAEWRAILRMLDRDAELFRQAVARADGDIEISMQDEHGVVANACETVARDVIGPRLLEAVHTTPIDRKWVAELHELIAHLTWAIDEAARIHEEHFPTEEEAA